MNGALMDVLQKSVLSIAAATAVTEIVSLLCGDEDNGTGLICGLCIAGGMLGAIGNLLTLM